MALEHLDQFLTIIALLLFLVNLVVNRLNSLVLVCAVVLCVQIISTIVRPLIINYVSPVSIEIGRILYYFGFSFICLFGVYLLGRLHAAYAVPVSFVSTFYARVLQFVAVLQLLRYVDRASENEYLKGFYSHAIPALVIATMILLTHTTVVVFKDRRKKDK